MNNYKTLKEKARQRAIEWQANFTENNYTWGELVYYSEYFERLGKRYRLLTEFKENGII